MHGPINVKSLNNTSKWQMGFNSAFKRLSPLRMHTLYLSVTNMVCDNGSLKIIQLPYGNSRQSYNNMTAVRTCLIAAKCSWSFVYCVVTCVCFLVSSCVWFYCVCITLVAGCWLEVRIRKATSAQVFLGFPVSISEC
jgi:hypothetical protein